MDLPKKMTVNVVYSFIQRWQQPVLCLCWLEMGKIDDPFKKWIEVEMWALHLVKASSPRCSNKSFSRSVQWPRQQVCWNVNLNSSWTGHSENEKKTNVQQQWLRRVRTRTLQEHCVLWIYAWTWNGQVAKGQLRKKPRRIYLSFVHQGNSKGFTMTMLWEKIE